MLIICPKCFEKYEIDTTQFNEEMHIFQCSNCGKRFEERVRFDDEKNENQQAVPPAFITEQPILAPLSENDYISSNRAAMDFSPQSSVVLPEEFTPVGDASNRISGKISFLIILLLVFGLVGGSVYIWMNKATLLKKYPEIQKAIELITTPVKPVSVPSLVTDEELPMEGEGDVPAPLSVQEMPKVEQVILTPIEQKMQKPATSVSDVAERILPVEVQEPVLAKTDASDMVPILDNVALEPVSGMQNEEPVLAEVLSVDETVEEVLAQDMPIGVPEQMQNNMLVPSQENVQKEAVLNPTEEIILEDIPMPDNIVVPSQDENQVEGNVLKGDVQIRDVSFKYDQVDEDSRLFVQGVIVNPADTGIKLPPLQVQLFDANNALLGVKDLPYGEAQMPAKSDEFFFYELSDVPAGTVAKIEVVVKG